MNLNSDFPEDTFPLSHQVAGHFHGNQKTKLGNLNSIIHLDGFFFIRKLYITRFIRNKRWICFKSCSIASSWIKRT
jgi:hypothetical protein